MSNTISICMIVKNEESVLPRALAHWRQLADELIVVDTGSTDNTVKVAEDLGATVLHYEWSYPGHKGEARNVGLDAATGDWIVVLDADEIINAPQKLGQWLRNPPDPSVTAINVLFENYEGNNLTLRWYQVRIFRRGMYRYIHREHEMPVWCGENNPGEIILQTTFEHRTPAGRAAGKMQPMIDRLRLDVEEHVDDPLPVYFLHRQYMLAEQYDESIEWGHRYLQLPHDKDRCETYGNIATCYYYMGDPQEAIRWLHRAAADQSHRRIWWIRLAEMHMHLGHWQIALAHLRLASELWPTFEWQWEPNTYGVQLSALIDKCQQELAAGAQKHG